jgi:hypothetical protein
MHSVAPPTAHVFNFRYQLSYALREGLVMQSGQVDTIKTQNDWWKYLLGSSGQSVYDVLPLSVYKCFCTCVACCNSMTKSE